MLTKIRQKIKPDAPAIIFFAFVTVLVMWQMLLPGFILTLDLVFTPKIKVFAPADGFYNSLPLRYLLHLVNFVVPGWVIEKVLLFLLLFFIGFLAYKFIPLPKKSHVKYWAGFFYLINPFVYERFLAGQWQILFAYALLPPLICGVLKLTKYPAWSDAVRVILWLTAIAIFSLHFLAIAVMVLILIVIGKIFFELAKKSYNDAGKLLFYLLAIALIFATLNSYWLMPALLNKQSLSLNNFDQANWQAFATAGDVRLGTLLNVVSLYGFWGENYPWARYFIWPKDHFIFWAITALILSSVIILGIVTSFRSKQKKQAWLFVGTAILGLIISSGISDTIFQGLNSYFFNHYYLFRGFRDSQKWSSLLALSYAYFGSLGAGRVVEWLQKIKIVPAKYHLILILLIPSLYTFTIWGGFARQLRPVWYPESWHQANLIMNRENNDKSALFLPWHQYLSLSFNQNIITQNPAEDYFDKTIIQSQDMELNGIQASDVDSFSQRLNGILLSNDQAGFANFLRENDIGYIIAAHDLDMIDNATDYLLKNRLNLRNLYDSSDLTLYRVMLR